MPTKKSERAVNIVGGLDRCPCAPQRFMALDLRWRKFATRGFAFDEKCLTGAHN
jgi:hypothetical protein